MKFLYQNRETKSMKHLKLTKEEEMHINETYEVGKSPKSIILEHTFNICTLGPDNQKADEATESGEALLRTT